MDAAEFVRKYRITARVEHGAELPPDADEWTERANAYTITLSRKGTRHRFTTPFFTGSGWKKDPTVEDVVGSLASDAQSLEGSGNNFESWASDLGYDPDSRKAERLYKRLVRQVDKLAIFLGGENSAAYQDLLDVQD